MTIAMSNNLVIHSDTYGQTWATITVDSQRTDLMKVRFEHKKYSEETPNTFIDFMFSPWSLSRMAEEVKDLYEKIGVEPDYE